jgi:uncharacterized protein with ATP-grasp and redox domains
VKLHLDCIPCLVRQTVEAARHLGLDDATAQTLLRRTLGFLPELDWELPSPVVAQQIHRAIRELTGNPDPYLREKISDTVTALELLPEIEALVRDSERPFLTAVVFSIAGNAIDLAAKSAIDADVEEIFRGALARPVDRPAVERLEETARSARDVLFLTDNAGEIVFDRPLLERIGPDKVTVALRGKPVINDATLDDARRSGITERFRVISNGSDAPGTWLSDCSRAFAERFEQADLVIAKGQGNYETLSDHPRALFFLFLVKCAAVAETLGTPTGTYVIRESPDRRRALRST